MRRLLVLVIAAGCSFKPGAASTGDGGGTRSDSLDACTSFSKQFDTCPLAGSAGGDLTLSGANTYDTDTGVLVTPDQQIPVTSVQLTALAGPVDAIVAHDVHLTANTTLRATGMLPLAIVAFGTVTLDGDATIDVSTGGAGARATCANGPTNGANDNSGAAGGGGAGFGAPGGAGGDGDADQGPSAGGNGGTAASPAPAGPLGGCSGANGGNGADAGGAGGAGGGAVYLVAQVSITLASGAGIDGGGAGGGGGQESGFSQGDAGGGGGGAGGYVALEAPQVTNGGIVAANGGGGGEASGNGDSGNPGMPGVLATAQAPGGTGGSPTGTDGGPGGAEFAPKGEAPTGIEDGGGGGGGGGVGYIFIVSPNAQAGITSPTAN